MEIKIAVCDDDIKDLAKLHAYVSRYGEKRHVPFSISDYRSGKELIDAIEQGYDPGIVLLDINMEQMDGLTAARRIREKLECVPIVLVTAYINYALEGYKVRANRFLVKDELDKTFAECMDDICSEIRRKNRTIHLSCVEGKIQLKVADIIMIEASGHRCMIHMENGKSLHIYEKLDALEEMLNNSGFVRTHRSFLVNMRHIQGLSNYVVTTDNGMTASVSRPRYAGVRRAYLLYIGQND